MVALSPPGDFGIRGGTLIDGLDRMQAAVREAMIAGAIGFASRTSHTHNGDRGRPVPSRMSDIKELRHLLVPLGDSGRLRVTGRLGLPRNRPKG